MTEKEFAEKIWEKSFSTVVIEYSENQPINKKQVDTIIKINLVCLIKMVKTIYRKYRESIATMEDMKNEFQALFYFASLQFAKGKSDEQLNVVLEDINIFNHAITKQYYKYLETYIVGKLNDLYIRHQKNENLIGNFELDFEETENDLQKLTYYQMYIENLRNYYSKENKKSILIPEVLLWYWCNREEILTKNQIEFMDNLNRNLADEIYGRANKKHYKERVEIRILRKYDEYQNKYRLKESKAA